MMYEGSYINGKRSCPNTSEPLSKRRCSSPQAQPSDEELEEGEYTETPVASPPKVSHYSSREEHGANGTYESGEIPSNLSSSNPGASQDPVSQVGSLEAGEVSAGNLEFGMGPEDMTSTGAGSEMGGLRRCQGVECVDEAPDRRLTGREILEKKNDDLVQVSWAAGNVCGEPVDLMEAQNIRGTSKLGDFGEQETKNDGERECFLGTESHSDMGRFRTRDYFGNVSPSKQCIGVDLKSHTGGESNLRSARNVAGIETVTHRNSSQYGGSCGTSDGLDYESGDGDREDSPKLQEGSTGQKGDFSDPFSDIDDSLINVDEEMDACKVSDRVQASSPQVGAGTAIPEMELNGVMSPRVKSDDEPPNESMPQRRGAELNKLTSLLSGDRTLDMDGVMVNSGVLQKDDMVFEQRSEVFANLQQDQHTEDVVAGAGTLEHMEEGADGTHDDMNRDISSPLLPERTREDDLPLRGLLPHYPSIDLQDRDTISKHQFEAPNPNTSAQVLSLVAEYGDDDEEDGHEECNEPKQEENPLPQNTLQEDKDKRLIYSEESKEFANEQNKDEDGADMNESETDATGAHTKHKSLDLPPHLKMLNKPSTPGEVAQDDGATCHKFSESSPRIDGEELDLLNLNNGAQDTACEDLEALLPDEYKDRAEGNVDPSIQETIRSLLDFQQTKNIFFNEEVMANKQFRNPCFLTKMSVHFGIDEFGTELVQQIYNPHSLPREDYADGLRAERCRRASTSQIAGPTGGPGISRPMGPPSAPPGVQNAILQGQRRLREKFTSMAAGKTRPSKWDTGQ